MKLVGYLRVSTEKQEDGLGLAVQEAAVRGWVRAHGHDLVGFESDTASGKLEAVDRGGLASALRQVREGDADGIVVYRLDRLARDLVVQEQLLAEVRNASGVLFSTSDAEQDVLDDDPDDPSRKLIRQVLGAVSEFERSMIALRLRNGRRRKHEQGGYAYGRPPYGYRAEAGELVAVAEQQAVLDRMRELRRGRWTLREIAATLNDEGVPGPAGGAWSGTAVQRALQRAGVKTARRKRRTKKGVT